MPTGKWKAEAQSDWGTSRALPHFIMLPCFVGQMDDYAWSSGQHRSSWLRTSVTVFVVAIAVVAVVTTTATTATAMITISNVAERSAIAASAGWVCSCAC